jgi:putative oxidoreductase
MTAFGSDKTKDAAILLARILLSLLFLIFGWGKLTNYSGTLGYFTQTGVPMPMLSTIIAIAMEFFVSVLIILGVFTRPLAVLLALYTLGTALIGHPYWTAAAGAQMESMINFYKNVSIIGGLLLLYVTGAGKYSIDAKINLL